MHIYQSVKYIQILWQGYLVNYDNNHPQISAGLFPKPRLLGIREDLPAARIHGQPHDPPLRTRRLHTETHLRRVGAWASTKPWAHPRDPIPLWHDENRWSNHTLIMGLWLSSEGDWIRIGNLWLSSGERREREKVTQNPSRGASPEANVFSSKVC